MGGVGAGVGLAAVAIVSRTEGFTGAKGSAYAGGLGAGIIVFAPIGYATDISHGPSFTRFRSVFAEPNKAGVYR